MKHQDLRTAISYSLLIQGMVLLTLLTISTPSYSQRYLGHFKISKLNFNGEEIYSKIIETATAIPSTEAYHAGSANAVAISQNGQKKYFGGDARFSGGQQFVVNSLFTSVTNRSFGSSGQVITNFNSTPSEQILAMVCDDEGRIITAGRGGSQFALARYLPNGSLDRSFNGDGKVLTDFRSSSFEMIYALAIDQNGKIIAGGMANVNNSGHQFALARYNQDGSLDRSFDGDGKVLTNFGSSSSEEIHGLVIDRDGTIIVAGTALVQGHNQFALARYNQDGSLDRSFDGDGKVLTNFVTASQEGAMSIVIDQRNNIVAGGYATLNGRNQFALARYTQNGRLDPSFHNDGRILTDINTTSEMIHAITITRRNRILAVGEAGAHRNPSLGSAPARTRFALVQYNYNGQLDNTFDGDGILATSLSRGSLSEGAKAVVTDSSGKIIVAGYAIQESKNGTH